MFTVLSMRVCEALIGKRIKSTTSMGETALLFDLV